MGVEKHLLVDGANIMHAWPDVRALLKRERAAAQAKLVGILTPLHDVGGARVTIVFDGSGSDLDVSCPGGLSTFAIVRTPSGMTADDFIERWVGRAAVPGDCCVATGDVGEGRTVAAFGAQWISPEELARWVERTEASLGSKLAGRNRDNDRNWHGRP